MCKQKSKRKGATVVEFAIVLPIVFLLFGVTIEISRMLLLQQTADTAAYEGARHAMVPGATTAEGIEETKRLLSQAKISNAQIIFEPETITEDTAAVSVHVKIPMADNNWFFSQFGDSYNITSDVTLLCERVPMVQLTGIPQIKAKAKNGGKSESEL